MWKILQQSPAYFIKFEMEEEDYVVSVTNYIHIWVVRLTNNLFLQVLKNSNEDTVFDDDDDLLEKGVCMISNPEQLKSVTITETDGTLKIMMTKLCGFLMFLNLNLVLSSNLCMYKQVIQPLLMTVKDLRESQSKLRQELKKKDKEIEEYKCEGGEIALRHLKTVMFDDTNHMKKHRQYEENFSDEVITQMLKPIDESKYSTINCGNNIKITEAKKEYTTANISETVKTENVNEEIVTMKTEPSGEKHRIENSIIKSASQDVKTEHAPEIETSESTLVKTEPLSQEDKSQKLIAIPPRKRQRNRLNF